MRHIYPSDMMRRLRVEGWRVPALRQLMELAADSLPVSQGGPEKIMRTFETAPGVKVVNTLDRRSRETTTWQGITYEGWMVTLGGVRHLVSVVDGVVHLFEELESHFSQRWRERGRPDLVPGRNLEIALRDGRLMGERPFDLEPVMIGKEGGMLYRFQVDGERFYTSFAANGWPKTVLTQDHMRRDKWYRKKHPHRSDNWKDTR